MSMKCTATKGDGKPCGAWAVTGSTKCALHSDPERAAKMGSKHGRKTIPTPDAPTAPMEPPKTANDLRDALAQVMSDVHAGRLEPKIARTIGYLASGLLKSIELSNVQNNSAVDASAEETTVTVDPAVQQLRQQHVYEIPEIRAQYGIIDPLADAIDAKFDAMDAARIAAVAARARNDQPSAGAEDAGSEERAPQQG